MEQQIYLYIANTLWIWGTNQSKITWHFIILPEPYNVTYMNILRLDLQVNAPPRDNNKRLDSQNLRKNENIYLIQESIN